MSSSRPTLTEQQVLNQKLLQALKEYKSQSEIGNIQEIIRAGADINAKDEEGKTPLMHAIEEKNYSALKVLIKAGADINAKDEEGKTPLMYRQTSTSIHLLLNAGADINAKDKEGKTALDYQDQGQAVVALSQKGCKFSSLERAQSVYRPISTSHLDEEKIIACVNGLKTPREQVDFLSSSLGTESKTPLDKLIELTPITDTKKREQYQHLKEHIQSIISSDKGELVTFTIFEKILNKIIPDRFRSNEILQKMDSKKAADIFRKKFQSTAAPPGSYTQTSGARQQVKTR